MDKNVKMALTIAGIATGVYAYTKMVYFFGFIKGGLFVVQKEIEFVGTVMKDNQENREKEKEDETPEPETEKE